jgi:hypothetical protein
VNAEEILAKLKSLGDPKIVSSMERFAISTPKSFGIPTPVVKQFAKELKKQAEDRHALAQASLGNRQLRSSRSRILDRRSETGHKNTDGCLGKRLRQLGHRRRYMLLPVLQDAACLRKSYRVVWKETRVYQARPGFR